MDKPIIGIPSSFSFHNEFYNKDDDDEGHYYVDDNYIFFQKPTNVC